MLEMLYTFEPERPLAHCILSLSQWQRRNCLWRLSHVDTQPTLPDDPSRTEHCTFLPTDLLSLPARCSPHDLPARSRPPAAHGGYPPPPHAGRTRCSLYVRANVTSGEPC